MTYLVRRFGFWLSFSAFVLTATPARELLKLPALLEHFSEHRQEKPDMSWMAFIILHYFSGSPRDTDYERDMQLPFKTVEFSPVTIAITHPAPEPFALDIPALPAFHKALPPPALLFPPTPYVAMPSEPPEA